MTATLPTGPGPVDWHSHVWLPEHLGEFGADLDAHYGPRLSEGGSTEAHRRAMDEGGFAASVVIALTSDHLDLHVPNEWLAEYVASDPRLVGVASVDPNRPSAVAELRAAASLGLRGLKLAPPYQNFHPHSPEAMAVYRAAADLGLFLIFHQGAVSVRRGVLEVAQPVLLDRVAREFPDLRIVVAHVGQPWFAETIALMRKHPNVFADLSARCERPSQLKSILLAALDYGVEDRLLFGSDFPVYDPGRHLQALLCINEATPGTVQIPDEVLAAIGTGRPLSLLGIG